MKKETPVKNALILCAITLVAGALLAIVNQLTLGPIEKAQLAAQAEAYVSVYPDADHFGAVDGAEELLAGSKEQLSAAGIQVGAAFGSRFQSRAELAGGVILILMGAKILLEHLGILG